MKFYLTPDDRVLITGRKTEYGGYVLYDAWHPTLDPDEYMGNDVDELYLSECTEITEAEARAKDPGVFEYRLQWLEWNKRHYK